jgi:DnaJ-class molecular chaperone
MTCSEKERKILCRGCGGSGQISFFKGVSRFLLSSEECPECSGLGYLFTDNEIANSAAANYDHSKTGERQSTVDKNLICSIHSE